MTGTPSSVGQFWNEAATLKDHAETELNRLLDQRTELEGEIRKLKLFIRSITPPDQRKTRSNARPTTRRSQEFFPATLSAYAHAILDLNKDRFDVHDLAAAVGRSPHAARKATERLRVLGMVRAAGKERGANQTSGLPRQQYSILNAGVADQLDQTK